MNPEDARLRAVEGLAVACRAEMEHTHQVTRLALRLFDELKALHRLGAEERFWLQCAGLLHDIGWSEGQTQHHKRALGIILHTPLLPFDARERFVIGSIARYHRKALPKVTHDHFAALQPADRETVRVLAALLRVADGLDRTHESLVQDLSCAVAADTIAVRCFAPRTGAAEGETALAKGNLLEEVFGRKLSVEWCLR